MSRSYRHRPFMAVTGTNSAQADKTMAARGMRRKQNEWLKNRWVEDDFLIPHRYECSHNETYSWGRDGCQRYQGLDASDWNRYQMTVKGLLPYRSDYFAAWPPRWYVEMLRK
jgi:hypothetical protein